MKNTYQNLLDTLKMGYKIRYAKLLQNGNYLFALQSYENEKNSLKLWKMEVESDIFVKNLYKSINNPTSELSRFFRLNRKKGIILIDIFEYSKKTLDKQLGLLARFQTILKINAEDKLVGLSEGVEGFVPTGDGCFIIISENCRFNLLDYAQLIEKDFIQYNSYHVSDQIFIKIAVNYGVIDYLFDLNNNWNYIGDGMNDTARMLTKISKTSRKKLMKEQCIMYISEAAKKVIMRGGTPLGKKITFKDKHKKKHSMHKVLR